MFFFLNLVLRAKRSCFPSPQNPIMFSPAAGHRRMQHLRWAAGWNAGWHKKLINPLGTYLFLLAEIWCMDFPYAILCSIPFYKWFWSGLNRYLNTQPNKIFGALGILKMIPFFWKRKIILQTFILFGFQRIFSGVYWYSIGYLAGELEFFIHWYSANAIVPISTLRNQEYLGGKSNMSRFYFMTLWHGRVRDLVLTLKHSEYVSRVLETGWWFHFFFFNPIWGRFPFWLIFFRWVETTN